MTDTLGAFEELNPMLTSDQMYNKAKKRRQKIPDSALTTETASEDYDDNITTLKTYSNTKSQANSSSRKACKMTPNGLYSSSAHKQNPRKSLNQKKIARSRSELEFCLQNNWYPALQPFNWDYDDYDVPENYEDDQNQCIDNHVVKWRRSKKNLHQVVR
jgi:hypothetical protein